MSDINPSSSKRRRWPLIFSVILLVAGAGFGGNWWLTSRGSQNSSAPGAMAQQPPPTGVKLASLTTGMIEDTSEVVGTIEAKDSVVLKTEIEGRISQILVKEGDRIQKGQPMMRLDSGDWEAELLQAKARLANSQARLAELQAGNRSEDIEEARAQLQEAQARLANANKGAAPEEIAQAQAQLESAQVEAELAEQRAKRYKDLRDEGAISADQFQEYTTQARSTSASVEQAKRRLAQLKKNRGSDLEQLAATVEQEQQNLRRLQNGPRIEVISQAQAAVGEAQAQVRMAQVNLSKAQIVAPISGKVGDIPVEVGDYIKEGDTLTTLTENNVVELNLSIPLEKAPQLRLGLPVEILGLDGNAIATGQISFISPDVTSDSQLVLAKASFSNVSGDLLNRQFIQAKVIWEKRPGILIPATAVSRLGGQTFVFIAKANDSTKAEKSDKSDGTSWMVEQRQVKLGSLQGNDYQVIEGLQTGEKIVTSGILALRDGAPIQPLQ